MINNSQKPTDTILDSIIRGVASVLTESCKCVSDVRYRQWDCATPTTDSSDLKLMLAQLTRDLDHIKSVEIPLRLIDRLEGELSGLLIRLEEPVGLGIVDRSDVHGILQSQSRLAFLSQEALFKQASLFQSPSYLRSNINELSSDCPYYASEIVDRALGIPYMLSGPWHVDHVPYMLGYQPISVREVIGLVPAMNITPADVFCDLGGGYGRPSLLVHLLSGARCISVEFITSTHEVAKEIAANNGINGVEYVNCDARNFDMSRANKFYLFNPFSWEILDTVVAKLEERVRQTGPEVTIAANGPCIRAFEQSRFFKPIEITRASRTGTLFSGALFKGRRESD
jgi:hypothetical protein